MKITNAEWRRLKRMDYKRHEAHPEVDEEWFYVRDMHANPYPRATGYLGVALDNAAAGMAVRIALSTEAILADSGTAERMRSIITKNQDHYDELVKASDGMRGPFPA